MARPLTAEQIVATLDKWGVDYELYPDWETRGRPYTFSNVNGLIVHHTGGGSDSPSYLEFLFEIGRPNEGIYGPLCQYAGAADGKIHVGATGRANHAGRGSSAVLNAVIAEDYDGFNEELLPGADDTDGNARFYGLEIIYTGYKAPTDEAYWAAVRWAAAICDAHGWSALSVISHREWSRRKWDPGYVDMEDFRRDVQALLDAGPGGVKPKPEPRPEPQPTPEPTWDGKSYPGKDAFRLGKSHPAVTLLGKRLVAHGHGKYKVGPGPTFSEVDKASVRSFQRAQGWTGADADGYPGPVTWKRLMAAPRKPVELPTVSLSRLRRAAQVDPPRSSSLAYYPKGTRIVESALVQEGHLSPRYQDKVGHFGSATVKAYAAEQRSQGYSGSDADGIPGSTTLTRLGKRHGFRVVT